MADYVYVAVTNIPNNYHASDLRAHFSDLVETKSFICFHFRHRPEKDPGPNEKESKSAHSVGSASDVKRCCIVKVVKTKVLQLLKHNRINWTNAGGETSKVLCNVSLVTLTPKNPVESEDDGGAVEEEKLLQMPELNPPDKMPNGNVGTPTLVFLDMIQKCLLPQNFIKKLQLKFPKTEGKRLYSNVNFDYHTPSSSEPVQEQKRLTKTQSNISLSSEKNKATFSQHKQPKLSFEPQSSSVDNHKIYDAQSVSKNYEGCEIINDTCDSSVVNSQMCESKATLSKPPDSTKSSYDSSSDETTYKTNSTFKQPSEDATSLLSARERKLKEKAARREMRKLMAEGIEERLIAIERRYHNDEDAEEWDRHEASEDDPSNQERNKERLYETEEETPWEKGGPGVVFYTDANFWQAREGDFDEQTTDDLDVDFSAYEEPGAGDKDIKDFLRIRQEERFRSGYDNTDRFSIGIAKRLETPATVSGLNSNEIEKNDNSRSPQTQRPMRIGEFEKFSKGVGRRVMERQGWQEGQGLGRSRPGIKTALAAHGQGPRNKSGLGYQEPSHLGTHPQGLYQGRKRQAEHHIISTVYDNPMESDPKVPLLERAEPTTLKHRQAHLEDQTASL